MNHKIKRARYPFDYWSQNISHSDLAIKPTKSWICNFDTNWLIVINYVKFMKYINHNLKYSVELI